MIRLYFTLILLLVTAAPNAMAGAIPKEHAETVQCTRFCPNICEFRIFSHRLKFKQYHVQHRLELYKDGMLAFSGKITTVSQNKKDRPQVVGVIGSWFLTETMINNILSHHILLDLSPSIRSDATEPSAFDHNNHESPPPLAFTNEWGEPVISVIGRMGTPASPTSRAGIVFEYSPNRHYPANVGFGSYHSPQNALLNEPQKEIKNVSLSKSLLLGEIGSQLALGLSLVHSRARISHFYNELGAEDKSSITKEFVGIVPQMGLRFTSEGFYLLTIDFGKYQPLGPKLLAFIGDTPVGSTVLEG